MRNCVDCFHFKMRRGWRYAYCSIGMKLDSSPQSNIKLFRWKAKSNPCTYRNSTLIERANRLKGLQETCAYFNNMRSQKCGKLSLSRV